MCKTDAGEPTADRKFSLTVFFLLSCGGEALAPTAEHPQGISGDTKPEEPLLKKGNFFNLSQPEDQRSKGARQTRAKYELFTPSRAPLNELRGGGEFDKEWHCHLSTAQHKTTTKSRFAQATAAGGFDLDFLGVCVSGQQEGHCQ